MKHVATKALRGSVAIIRKGDAEDPASIVTKALGDFSTEFEKKFDDRFKALESKGVDPKLIERLDKIEAKTNRPGKDEKTKDEQAEIEQKAFGEYLRHGKEAGPDTLKTLIVSSDPQGGYLAPTEMSTEFIRELVQYSPIRGLGAQFPQEGKC